jgi:hypothetical protein
MLESLDVGLKAAGPIVSLVESIASRILSIGDRRKKKAELIRLIQLINETRISRTLNAGLSQYLRNAIEDYKRNTNKKEIEIVVQQIEKSISSIIEIIDKMSDECDRVAIYKNASWNELHSVVSGRRRLLDELKQIDINSKNLKRVVIIAEKYERLTDRLSEISFDLSKYGRELDNT